MLVAARLEVGEGPREEEERRIHSQMPLMEKEKLADRVVPNHGTLGELEKATREAVEAIVGER